MFNFKKKSKQKADKTLVLGAFERKVIATINQLGPDTIEVMEAKAYKAQMSPGEYLYRLMLTAQAEAIAAEAKKDDKK